MIKNKIIILACTFGMINHTYCPPKKITVAKSRKPEQQIISGINVAVNSMMHNLSETSLRLYTEKDGTLIPPYDPSQTEHTFLSKFRTFGISTSNGKKRYFTHEFCGPETTKPMYMYDPQSDMGAYLYYYDEFIITVAASTKTKISDRFVLTEAEFAKITKLPVSDVSITCNSVPIQELDRMTIEEKERIARDKSKDIIEGFIKSSIISGSEGEALLLRGYKFNCLVHDATAPFVIKPTSQLKRDRVPFFAATYDSTEKALNKIFELMEKYYQTRGGHVYLDMLLNSPNENCIRVTYYQPVPDAFLMKHLASNLVYTPLETDLLDVLCRPLGILTDRIFIKLDGSNSPKRFKIVEGLQNISNYMQITKLIVPNKLEQLTSMFKANDPTISILPTLTTAEYVCLQNFGKYLSYVKLISNQSFQDPFAECAIEQFDRDELVNQVAHAGTFWRDWDNKSIFFFNLQLDKVRSFGKLGDIKQALKRNGDEFDHYVAIEATNLPCRVITGPTFRIGSDTVYLGRSFGYLDKDDKITLCFRKCPGEIDERTEIPVPVAEVETPEIHTAAPAAAPIPPARRVFNISDFPAATKLIDFGRFDLGIPELVKYGNKSSFELDENGRKLFRRHGYYAQFETAVAEYIEQKQEFITHPVKLKLLGLELNQLCDFNINFFTTSLNQAFGFSYQPDFIHEDLIEHIAQVTGSKVRDGELAIYKSNLEKIISVASQLTVRIMYTVEDLFVLVYNPEQLFKVYRLMSGAPAELMVVD